MLEFLFVTAIILFFMYVDNAFMWAGTFIFYLIWGLFLSVVFEIDEIPKHERKTKAFKKRCVYCAVIFIFSVMLPYILAFMGYESAIQWPSVAGWGCVAIGMMASMWSR